ncbi:MAG: hydroxymethylbilane synthase, partial [Acidothermaceae bacterium]
AFGAQVEIVGVTTDGDRSARANSPLSEAGGVGVFVTELRNRLLARHVDVVVHSLKDLPTGAAEGLTVAAIPVREDPADALVARDGLTLVQLPTGSTVGTGSPRRAAQLRSARPDLDVQPLRGNVDTRIGKVASGALDAIVVAAAGLARLGRLGEATEIFAPDVMLPAPGQGALAIECRAEDVAIDGGLHAFVAQLDDFPTRAAVVAERTVLAGLEAGCTAPVGALASVRGPRGSQDLHLVAVVVSVDGVTAIRGSATGSAADPEDVGRRLAADLLEAGAADVVGARP